MITTNLLQKSLFPILLIFIAALIACSDGPGVVTPPAGTFVVDQGGSGDFSTVQGAINAAMPGSTIQIMAGTFQEQIVVDKNLVLKGAGAATVLSMSGPKQAFSDDVTDDSTAVMEVRNTGGVLIENLTFSGPQDGLIIRNSSGITVTNVTATGNGDDGIDIRNSQGVTVSGTFSQNGDKGVQIREGSSGVMIQSSQMSDNTDRGVNIRDALNSSVVDSTINSNGDDGIRVRDSSGIQILRNTITNNLQWGIRTMNSNPDMRDNTFSGNVNGDLRQE